MNPYESALDKYLGMVKGMNRSYEQAKLRRPEAFRDPMARKKAERDEITRMLQKVKDSGGKAFKEKDMSGWLEK